MFEVFHFFFGYHYIIFFILRVLVILLSLCLFLMVFLAISDCFGVLLIHVFIVIPI